MGTHFLSVLGTGLYEPVVYGVQGDSGAAEQEFVQIALMERFAEQLKDGGKITILLTNGARKANWENRVYSQRDVELSGRWASARKEQVRENAPKIGMEVLLQENYRELYEITNDISIPNASMEQEIWDIFETIYNAIDEGDEIIFDITHSFRSIPMLAMTIINYAKVMKACTLKGIYYGAYEAGQMRDGVKYAPIVDLTVYNEILEWTNAAEAFMQYGVAAKMKEVYDNKMKSFVGDRREWQPIGNKIKAMQDLSMAIFTCRGAGMTGEKGNAQKSVESAYAVLKKKSTEESTAKAREIKPLFPLLEKIGESYASYFNKENNVEIGLGVVEWSIKNNMIQQGYTALEETMITYLCNYYGIDDRTEKTRENIVGRTITGIIYKYQDLFKKSREDAAQEMLKNGFPGADETEREQIRKIVLTIPGELLQLCDKVKNRRNDINHFGFRLNPAKSDSLADGLQDYYNEFVKIIEAMNQTKTCED